MNLQQENFCLEYVKCGNAYKAMIAAGYSESTARADSARLLSYPDVQERLQELQHSIAQAAEVTTLMIVLELKKIAFANIGDLGGVMNLKDYDALPADAKAGIAGFRCQRKEKNGEVTETVHIRMHNKLTALRMLARMLGFTKPSAQKKEPAPAPVAEPMQRIIVVNPKDLGEQGKNMVDMVAARDREQKAQQKPASGNPARPAAQTPPPAHPSALLPRRNRSNDPRANPYYTHRRSDMFNTRHPRHVG